MAKRQRKKRKHLREHITAIRISEFKPLILAILAVAVILSGASIGFGLIKQGPSEVAKKAMVSPSRATTYPSRIARSPETTIKFDSYTDQNTRRSHKNFQRR